MGSDETEANRLQGTASIHTVGRGREPKPPLKGYAPLESRTKRWATESQIEGWFPLQSGERDGCERLPDCDADPASAPLPTLSRRPGNPNHADADGQKMSRRRVGKVRLDRQPHRRVCKKRGDVPFRWRLGQSDRSGQFYRISHRAQLVELMDDAGCGSGARESTSCWR